MKKICMMLLNLFVFFKPDECFVRHINVTGILDWNKGRRGMCMGKKKFVMGIGAVILSMAIIFGIKEGIKIFVAGSTEETQISQDKYEEQDSKILETASKLGGDIR